jgi:hypothetical protein
MTWQMRVDLAWKMLRQRAAKWPRRCGSLLRSYSLRFFDDLGNDEIFDLEFELFDLPEHLLALAAEEHMLQLLDQQRKPIDLGRPRAERLAVTLVLCDHQCPHRFKIKRLEVRERSGQHERSMP